MFVLEQVECLRRGAGDNDLGTASFEDGDDEFARVWLVIHDKNLHSAKHFLPRKGQLVCLAPSFRGFCGLNSRYGLEDAWKVNSERGPPSKPRAFGFDPSAMQFD